MEVLIDNKDGIVWDMPVSSIKWKTTRMGKPGELELTLINGEPLKYPIENGAVVRVMEGKQKIFYGYVVEAGSNMSDEMSVKALDQMRYMLNEDTYVFKATTATAAIKKIASDLGIKAGAFEDTGYKVPGIVEDGKKALDVATKFLDSSLIATNRSFVLFDDFGELTLKNIKNLLIPAEDFFIGENSLLYDFDYTKSIDSETFNRIKLVHDDKKKSKREVYIFQDSKNIAKWGRLQEFRKVDENMKPAQIKDLGDKMLKLKNREMKTLDLDCLGDWRVRAGSMVYVYIEKIGIAEHFLVEECTHTFEGGIHTMSLKVKVI